jgi:L-arabinose isomerase
MEDFAEMANIEYVSIDDATKISEFKKRIEME